MKYLITLLSKVPFDGSRELTIGMNHITAITEIDISDTKTASFTVYYNFAIGEGAAHTIVKYNSKRAAIKARNELLEKWGAWLNTG